MAGSLAWLSDFVSSVNSYVLLMTRIDLNRTLEIFDKIDHLFGFDIVWRGLIPEEIKTLMEKRFQVRAQIKATQDKTLWKDSDALRDQIQSQGWLVKDAKPGEPSTLKRKRRVWDL